MPAIRSYLPKNPLKLLATAAVLLVSVLAAAVIYRDYVLAPWTRDGRTRVQVANVAPQVSGQITELHVADNQVVRRGDVLYVIDPFDFRTALAGANATVQSRNSDLRNKQTEADRRGQPGRQLDLGGGEAELREPGGPGRGGVGFGAGAAAAGGDQPGADHGAQPGERGGDQPADAGRRLCAGGDDQHHRDRHRQLLGRRLLRGDQARLRLHRRPGPGGAAGLPRNRSRGWSRP